MQHIYLHRTTPLSLRMASGLMGLTAVYLCWYSGSFLMVVVCLASVGCAFWRARLMRCVRAIYISHDKKDSVDTQLQLCYRNRHATGTSHWHGAKIVQMRPVLGGFGVRISVRVEKQKTVHQLYVFANGNSLVVWKRLLRLVRLRYYVPHHSLS